MSFLLKIVEGPNKGAEIALVDGVAVTLGKGDDCDIVLADSTMPDSPLKIEASGDSVMAGNVDPDEPETAMEPLEPFAVKTLGATSFAIGPADAPWGELKWPRNETESPESPEKPESSDSSEKPESPKHPESSETSEASAKKRGWGCGCAVVLIVLTLVLLALAWFFRDRIRESDRFEQFEKIGRDWYSRISKESRDAKIAIHEKTVSLSDIAEKYGLSLSESNGTSCVFGNLRTRRERLAATAEAYEVKPGVELDLSDDESFRSSAEDALFTLTEGALKVVSATNRVLSISGVLPSPMKLRRTLEALSADLAKLREVDVSRVVIGGVAKTVENGAEDDVRDAERGPMLVARRMNKKSAPSLPVCGILTTPYPCLVMRDGRRIMEGAAIGDSVIVEIGADSVTLTNATGRFTWKP